MGRLSDNLHRMSNVEWNNLAKNSYCDDNIQVWIAHNAHLRARYYLAENPSICDEAMQIILSGRSVLAKALMISSGAIQDSEVIRDLYLKCKNKFDSWRIQDIFVRRGWGRQGVSWTPGDVLESIYDDYCVSVDSKQYYHYLARSLAQHQNCSLKLAIQLSQHESHAVNIHGKEALVRISREQKETHIL